MSDNITTSRTQLISLRLPHDIVAVLKKLAKQKKTSQAQIVAGALRKQLNIPAPNPLD